MALEGLRGYLELASGLTLASRQRAREVAASLVSPSGLQQAIAPLGTQAQQVAEELMATSRANRDLLMALVRGEVERAVAALGVPSAEEVRRLDRRVTRLEQAVAEEGSPVRTAAQKAARRASADGASGAGAGTGGSDAATTGTAATRARATRTAAARSGAAVADHEAPGRPTTTRDGAAADGTDASASAADGAAGTKPARARTTRPATGRTGVAGAPPEAGP